MHFIGNRAITLGDGRSQAQIVYNSGFTAVSFFLPIGVLLGAFYLLGVTESNNQVYIAGSGILTGAAVCGMHYVGQLGIANYHCHYRAGNVVGSAIIAVLASLVALSVFFRFRAAWTNQWWKRLFCASILACAVSGMHWIATVGTSYTFKGLEYDYGSGLSRSQTVIICAVLVSLPSAGFYPLADYLTGLRSERFARRFCHHCKPNEDKRRTSSTAASVGLRILRRAGPRHGHTRRHPTQSQDHE